VLLHLLCSTVLRGRWNLDMQLPPHYPRRIRSPPSFLVYYRDPTSQLSTRRLNLLLRLIPLRRGGVYQKALRSEAGTVPLGMPRGERSEDRERIFLAGKNPRLSEGLSRASFDRRESL
jgi:hypothetical protein